MNFANLLIPFLTTGPQVLSDAEDVFNGIAHGEGGAQKIATVMQSLAHLFTHASAAAASIIVPPSAAPQPEAQAAEPVAQA